MSDKRHSKDRYHPPLTYERYRTMQTIRMPIETECEPVLQTVIRRNRTLSSASADEVMTQRRINVADLVEQIEKRNSTQNSMFLSITRLELHKYR